MAPMLKVVLAELDNHEELSSITRRYFDGLVSQLLRLADRIEYSDFGEVPVLVSLQPSDFCHLAHINCSYESNGSLFVHIARQNAQTLQSLVLNIVQSASASSLIQCDDGSHVLYPHLASLKLWWWPVNDKLRRPVFSGGVVPFPSLRSIRLLGFYPFGDDTLFRGNAATLECLEIKLDAPTVAMLCKYI
ncbi:hypothetical protein GGI21_005722, partial [Coemansia aciculifera]